MRALCQTLVAVSLAAGMLWAQNVGIGTTTPLTRLHVAAGDIFLGDATGANGFILHSRYGTGYDFLQISTRTGGSYEWSKGITLVRSNGFVGIGTTAPGAKLDVYGGDGTFIRVSGAMPAGDGNQGLVGYELINSSAGGYWRMYLADPDGGYGVAPRSFEIWEYPANLGTGGCCRPRLRILSSNGLADPTEVVINPVGNVGIGTTAPAERLHVEGNIRFSGALMPGGNAGTTGQVLVSQGAGNAPQWKDPSALTGFYKLLFVDAWNPSVNSNLGWSCTNCSGGAPYLTTCGTVRMLGGYNMCGNGCYFEKTFTGLPAHTEVMVEVFWWSVDSWDQFTGNVDLIALSIDGIEVSRATPYGPVYAYYPYPPRHSDASASICGLSDWIDIGPQPLVGWATHTAANVTVRITNLANQVSTDESMGIVMVRVWVK
jgi:hypothetical protein